MGEKCSTKFCRKKVELVYLGKPLCQKCYEKICEEEKNRPHMTEAENCLITNNKVKDGETCVYSKTHICNGKECKPYPCGYYQVA